MNAFIPLQVNYIQSMRIFSSIIYSVYGYKNLYLELVSISTDVRNFRIFCRQTDSDLINYSTRRDELLPLRLQYKKRL